MPIGTFTTIWAITKLWAGVELVGKAAFAKAGQQAGSSLAEKFGIWIAQKTGLKDKEREKVFLEAYHKAEQKMIEKKGLPAAYRVFRLIPSLVDTDSIRVQFILDILEEQSIAQKRISTIIQNQIVPIKEVDTQNVIEFMYCLRQSLFETTLYRSLIEFYDAEDARKVRELTLQEIEQLSGTIDDELRAVRVTVVESVNLEKERQIYLEQLEAFFEEQDFIGFPELREQKRSTLLKDIYVLLKLKYMDGGEALNDELGKLVATQLKKGD